MAEQQASRITVRQLKRTEVSSIQRFADNEGWDENTFSCHLAGYNMNPTGWLVAENDSGTIIGICCGIALSEDTSVMGLYTVDKGYRGQGIGRRLWKAVKETLGERNIFIYALDVNLYLKDNFTPFHEFHVVQGRINCELIPPKSSEVNYCIVQSTDVSFPDLNSYDKSIHKIDRAEFLKNWILADAKCAFVAVENSTKTILGYGALRKTIKAWGIFPLYAETMDVAQSLFRELMKDVPYMDKVCLCQPLANKEAVVMTETMGFSFVVSETLMYSKHAIDAPMYKVYSRLSATIDFV